MRSAASGLTRQTLAIPAVRRVVLAFAALTQAEWVLGTVVAIDAYDDGGALAVGLVGFRFAPAALASLVCAPLGERFGRRRVLTATALVRAGAAVAVAAALATGLPFAVVLAFVWIDAVAGSAYRPAQAGLLPALVTTPAQLTAAVVLTSNAKTSGQVLGALAGGLLIVALSAPAAVVVAAALYAIAALLTRLAGRGRSAPARGDRDREPRSLRRQLRAAITALNGEPETRRIAAWSCARSLIRGLWISLGVIASLTILGLGASGFGLLMAAAGVGTAISIVLTARLVGRPLLARPLVAGIALCCLPPSAIGLLSDASPALALMVAWGIGMSLSDVCAQALLNRVVAPRELPRVVGAMESAKLLAEGLGSLLGPGLVAVFGIRGALVGSGLGLFVVLVADLRRFWAIDRRAVGRSELLGLVRGVPLFAPLRVDGLEAVVAPLVSVDVPAGHEVVRQDTVGSRWYLVREGHLEVVVNGYVVNHLERGDSFGERGLLRDESRNATVRATGEVSLLALEREDFLRAVMGEDDGAPIAALEARATCSTPCAASLCSPGSTAGRSRSSRRRS